MMRALLVGMHWFPNRAGGLNRYFFEAVHALAEGGLTGTAVVTEVKPEQKSPLALRSMAPENASGGERRLGVRRVVREELSRGVDIVNAHFALYAYPWLSDLPASTPLVSHFHGPWAMELAVESRGIKNLIRVAMARHMERRVYGSALRVITLSQAFADIAHERYGVPKDRLRVVPGGVNTALYCSAPERRLARERLGWPQDRPILLAVRRLSRRMGLEQLLEAVAAVRRRHPNVLALIGGKGALTAELQATIEREHLQENARLLGFIADEDLPAAYAAADLTLVPTVALEGFGLVIVESLASGTPALGTPVGGIPEILRAWHPELVTDAPTSAAMAERIDAILSGRVTLPDPEECRIHAGRYDWKLVVPQLLAIFEEARVSKKSVAK